MPLKPEHRFRNKVRKKLNRTIDVWSIHDSFTGGVPDHWYSGWESDLWIEYKYFPKLPRKPIDLTSGKHPKLTRLQQHWLNRKLAQGRDVWVVVGFPEGAVILTDGEAWTSAFDASRLMVPLDVLVTSIEHHCGVNNEGLEG